MTRIGLAYVSGAVPGFEDFGNLPTDIVKENGLVDGNKASKELDALIIPGGTLIESNDINMPLNSEIKLRYFKPKCCPKSNSQKWFLILLL